MLFWMTVIVTKQHSKLTSDGWKAELFMNCQFYWNEKVRVSISGFLTHSKNFNLSALTKYNHLKKKYNILSTEKPHDITAGL